MAITPINSQNITPIPIVWDCSDFYNKIINRSIFSKNCIQYNDISNSRINSDFDKSISETIENYNTKIFVKFIKKINDEFNEIKNIIGVNDFSIIKEKIETSLSVFVELKVDKFSAELTNDLSIFYTMKKNTFTYYIEEFLDTEENELEKYVITIFENKKIIKNKTCNEFEIINIIEHS